MAYVQEFAKRDRNEVLEEAKVEREQLDQIILDIHFYLICWDKVNKFFGAFAKAEEDDACINKAWNEVRSLTKKASLARHYFEHFDLMLSRGTGNVPLAESLSFSGNHFEFGYSQLNGKGEKLERKVTLGRSEVEKVMLAYEEVLSCLGADLTRGYFHVHRVNRENGEV